VEGFYQNPDEEKGGEADLRPSSPISSQLSLDKLPNAHALEGFNQNPDEEKCG